MKNKDLCYHDPRCIMSCGFMVDEIIMDHIKITESSKGFKQGHDCFFTQMDIDMIYIYRGTLQKKYIMIPSLSLHPLFIEEKPFITV